MRRLDEDLEKILSEEDTIERVAVLLAKMVQEVRELNTAIDYMSANAVIMLKDEEEFH